MKIGEKPKLRYQNDGVRYIVMLGDDRAGFVAYRAGEGWHASDTFMRKSRLFKTRKAAGEWLKKETERAIKAGEL